MSTKTLEIFFTGKNLVIPHYQRDYAWKPSNVDDLFEDVEEALQVKGGHYLGTFILSQSDRSAPVFVVDGQQRLTTLTMILDALIDAVEDPAIRQHYRSNFISHPVTGAKFKLQGGNGDFFVSLLAEQNPAPATDGQQRLLDAYERIQLRVGELRNRGGEELVKQWLSCLSQLEVLEFVEPDEGKAIRMFQSVNDRGVPLARMDIVKSLLVYYSNRYLDGELDQFISEQFGLAFHSFSRIKRLAAEDGYRVRLVNRDSFREDDVLRYHYFAFDGSPFELESGADYSATADTVLETFLKPGLRDLRNDPSRLRNFIDSYSKDLAAFFGALEALLVATRTDIVTYLLFVVQDLSATLYPLVIRLHLQDRLSAVGTGSDQRSLQKIIEMVDLRVFKLRGTNPQADVFRITAALSSLSVDEIISGLKQFCRHFMPDALMQSQVENEYLYRNAGVPRMLLEVEFEERKKGKKPRPSPAQLVALNCKGLTVEHILPQEPNFKVRAYGFRSRDHYEEHKHRIGNLVLIEDTLNKTCSNRTVEDKMSAPECYQKSGLWAVKALSAIHTPPGQPFRLLDIDNRAQTIANLMLKRWPI
ncbi:DUF262 domain-containing protein [Thiorhodovibrio frisius]|uniref:DUF262 domain-containing protein n=1 Tax=Thiorhodovibrio frisius TaxID=631362 RepID=H8Z473_9GAMM|nr:DUF262 domain-containing protein [Thiorhodovibrio frisius]EIC20130.1 hypothetical protein Thi970DRAFT_03748 [Thiorhodovibrio frisius]WPL20864.1 hypothetical protein Thiofri_00970 [Thiorhodovibrio frisius]